MTAGEITTNLPKHLENFEIRKLQLEDLDDIERVFRIAFGTQLAHPQPEQFASGRSSLSRLLLQPDGAFGAYIDNQLVGFACAVIRGSLGIFGPLAVIPERWGVGIAQRLLSRTLNFFVTEGVRDTALCTFPDSPRHISLYKKFGFHPGHLVAMMTKLVSEPLTSHAVPELDLFSRQSSEQKIALLKRTKSITSAIFKNLDFSREIQILDEHSIGETVLLKQGDELNGFAICHFGPRSETETDIFYVKFAAVFPDQHAENNFRQLIENCETLARERQLNTLFCGVNTARQEAFECMLSEGYKIDSLSLSMQMSNRSSYNRGGVYVLDDWR